MEVVVVVGGGDRVVVVIGEEVVVTVGGGGERVDGGDRSREVVVTVVGGGDRRREVAVVGRRDRGFSLAAATLRRTTLLHLFLPLRSSHNPLQSLPKTLLYHFNPIAKCPSSIRLGSLFRSSIKSTPATTTTAAAAAKTSPAVDKSLKHFSSSLDASSASTPKRTLVNSHKRPQPSKPPSPAHLSSLVSISVDTSSCSDSEDPTRPVCHDTPSILSDGLSFDLHDSKWDNGRKPSEDALEGPWLSDLSNYCSSLVQKACRENKQKGFNALLKICMENASTTDDETVALEHVSKAFEVFMSMKEQGFPIEEESYGQVLLYLIDRGMVEQFHHFTDVIRYGSASTFARLHYYEMLLYMRVNDEEKIQEFINCIFTSDGDGTIRVNDEIMFLELINWIFPSDGDETVSLRDGLPVDLLDSEGDNGGKPSEDALEATYCLGDRKLGGETVMEMFNELLNNCIETAGTTDDWMVVLNQVSIAFEVFISMEDHGFPIEEESYGPVLFYLIESGMVGHFHLLTDFIRSDCASTLSRLDFYEMLLYIRVNDEEKIQEFINRIFTSDRDGTISLRDVVPRAVVDGGDC